ncbi:MAG: hypothetical protein EHM35_03240, partial [Planctomycetaceae bacterium]
VQTFTYDHLDRLTRGWTSGAGTWGQYDESSTYNDIGNMITKAGVTYTYDNAAHKHAVSSTGTGGLFNYDANGNMTSRRLTSGGPTYTQVWDYDNRLASVTVSGAATTFTYDGNGTLAKKVAGGQTTVYVGPHYEKNVTTGQVTKYYFFGAQRVAMNKGGVVYYVAGDHLGTTSVVINANGTLHSEARHYPYGTQRWTNGTVPTDYRFTDQRFESSLNIYIMGARWYEPYLNQFLSPDSIIPDPANPQSLNRYMYCLGNPLKYTDPTGHKSRKQWEEEFTDAHNGQEPTDQDWWDYQFSLQFEEWFPNLWQQTYDLRSVLWNADVTLKADDVRWTLEQAGRVRDAVTCIAERFGGDVRRFIGGVTVVLQSVVMPWWERIRDPNADFGGYEYWGHVYLEPTSGVGTILHEMGHYFDEANHLSRAYQKELRGAGLQVVGNRYEDFANAFRVYVLRMQMDPVRERYLDQFRISIFPHANGYLWIPYSR